MGSFLGRASLPAGTFFVFPRFFGAVFSTLDFVPVRRDCCGFFDGVLDGCWIVTGVFTTIRPDVRRPSEGALVWFWIVSRLMAKYVSGSGGGVEGFEGAGHFAD